MLLKTTTARTMFVKGVILALCVTLCSAVINNPTIYRPCALNNLACIRNSLRSSSRCQAPRGSAPPVYTVPRSRFDAPAFNASYEDINMVIRGLDRCFVSEYSFNRKTNGRVLALDCPWLNFESSRVMYQHYPRREDGIFRYNINGSYPLMTFTLPMKNDICVANPSAYVHELPAFNISPLDPQTSNHLTRDLSALSTFEQETFAGRVQFLTRAIINNLLCNFGCN